MSGLNKIHDQIYNWSIDSVIKSNSNKILFSKSKPVNAINKIVASGNKSVEHAIIDYTKVDFILLINSLYIDTDHRIDIRIQNHTYKEFLLNMMDNSKIEYDMFNTSDHPNVSNDVMKSKRFGIWEYPNSVMLKSHYRVIINSGYKYNSILQLDVNII